jgi:aminoglycoside phosphotransferase (APT) family kinase protein
VVIMTQPAQKLQSAAAAHGYTSIRLVGAGLEFSVYEAVAADGGRVVLRTPADGRFQSNANDPAVDTRALLRWEYTVTRHVADHGIPVATPRELVLGEPDLLVNGYVPDDGRGVDQYALGGLLRHLHGVPPPPATPVATEGLPVNQLLPVRILRRWGELAAIVADLPAPPDAGRMADILASFPGSSLVHLDVRAANLRCVNGAVVGLLDWSNALVADPALELGRLAEFARLPNNGLDIDAVLAGYGESVPLDSVRLWIYQLDAAVMLAVVFTFEAPDQKLREAALDRLREVRARLLWEWDR